MIEKIEAVNAFEVIQYRDTANTALIDGRSHEMYSEKHIADAINIDAFSDSLNTTLKDYLNTEEIIVYCTNHERADTIVVELEELKYAGHIIFISDGITGWITAEYETINTLNKEL